MATKTPIILDGSGANAKHSPLDSADKLPGDSIPWDEMPVQEIDWCDALSDDPENQLQCTDKGKLFYKEEPPPDIATLYVSTSEGDDSNAGTRAAPLKTFMEALRRQNNRSVTYTILLKAGEEFVMDASVNRELATYSIEPYGESKYGDTRDGTWDACNSYQPWTADDYNRPTLYVQTREWGTEKAWLHFTVSSVSFIGLKLRARENPDFKNLGKGGDDYWVVGDLCEIAGCDVSLVDPDDSEMTLALADAATLQLSQRNKFPNGDYTYGLAFTKFHTPQITNPKNRGDGAGAEDGCGVNTPYTGMTDNIVANEEGDVSRIVHAADWDLQTGVMFNFHLKWDPRGSVAETNLIPSFTYSSNDLTVSFTDTSTIDTGNIDSWHWYFGDGQESTSQNPSHTYSNSGTYGVTLVVGGGGDVKFSTTANVSSSVSSGGSGGGGGGGSPGGSCVVTTNVVEGGMLVGDVKVGTVLSTAHEDTLSPGEGAVNYSKIVKQPCVRVTTANGAVLECSESANIPTEGSNLVRAINLMGHRVGTKVNGAVDWDDVKSVEKIGEHQVNHLGVDNASFWAGVTEDAMILHHNAKNKM